MMPLYICFLWHKTDRKAPALRSLRSLRPSAFGSGLSGLRPSDRSPLRVAVFVPAIAGFALPCFPSRSIHLEPTSPDRGGAAGLPADSHRSTRLHRVALEAGLLLRRGPVSNLETPHFFACEKRVRRGMKSVGFDRVTTPLPASILTGRAKRANDLCEAKV